DFLERLRLPTVQAEALKNDLLLAVVQNIQQSADLVAEIFIAQQLTRRLRLLIADDFAEFGRIVVTDRRVECSRSDRNRFELRDFPARDADLVAKLFIGWFAALLFAHPQRNATDLG